MTYFQFHLVFILPPLFLLLLWSYRSVQQGRALAGSLGQTTRFALLAMVVHVLIALVYTTPWDNYLVYREVWGYPPGRVLATIGYVPIEEYLFFILQTLLSSLLLFGLARHINSKNVEASPTAQDAGQSRFIRLLGTAVSLGIAASGLIALTFEQGTYIGLILVWAGPVLAIQWAFGGDWLLERWRLIGLAIALPTVYLWLADRIAIGLGIWWISKGFTVGVNPFGLPIEEMLFFMVTNVFVIFGLSLALHPDAMTRTQNMLTAVKSQAWWKGVLALWALSMIPTPLFPALFPVFSYASTALLTLAVLGYALERYGKRAWLLFAVAFSFGVFIEWIGETFGVPFGRYSYTATGPNILGVPLLVPLGWFAFTLIALSITPVRLKLWTAPLALVAWDLGLDPLMVRKGFWQFDAGGLYYGVPLSNFLGWYVSGVLLVWLLFKLEPRLKTDTSANLKLVFVAQAFLFSVGLAFFGMPGAGAVTLLAMGLIAGSGISLNRLPKRQFE